MTIYLDIIFLLNVLFNTLLLYFTSYFRKKTTKKYRLWLGGTLGASSVFFMFTSLATITMHPIFKLLLSLLIILITFSYVNWQSFFKDLLAFYLTTFLFGGILLGVHYFFQFNSSAIQSFFNFQSMSFGDPISWLFVLIGFPIAYLFSKRQIDSYETTKIQYDELLECQLRIENEVFSFPVLVDSGNNAKDAITSRPVNFISYSLIKEKLPQYEILTKKKKDFFLSDELTQFLVGKKFTFVPYSVLGNETNLVIAFVPQSLTVKIGEEIKELTNCYISLVDQSFSSEDKFLGILNPKSLQ